MTQTHYPITNPLRSHAMTYGTTLQPLLWPKKVRDLSDEHRALWCDYWAEDLVKIRFSYPELERWDSFALIAALTEYFHAAHGKSEIDTKREPDFLEWVRRSCEQGRPLSLEEMPQAD